MSDVRLERVTKVFDSTVAVDDVSLHVQEGEFFSLLGPSGCGKTTTLRMVGGFEDPTEGTIYLGQREVLGLPPYKRDVNTVFQSYALFPHFDVFENVAYGLRRKKVAAAEIDRRVHETLELVDLPGFGKRRTTQLSGGQQQRVALARALVNRPQVLLLDEPLGALDLKLRKQMQLELKRIQSEVGITFIYVTHDQEEAMTMSNRLAVMDRGRLEQVGAPDEVYESPRTEFVASFLGASNLIDGAIEGTEDGWTKVRLAPGGVVSLRSDRVPATAGRVRVGVRPEKIHISTTEEPSPGDNVVVATVELSTYTGVATTYECRLPDGTVVVAYVQNRGPSREPLPRGASATLSWAPEHTFAVERLDPADGKENESA